jgi:hypothetical protein
MEEVIYNTTNDFIYLRIPNEYDCIYQSILSKLATVGIKDFEDCRGLRAVFNCNPCGKTLGDLMDAWNMFQIACTSYEIGQVDKADTIINHINSKYKLGCPTLVRKYSKIIYFGDSYVPVTEEIILAGSSIDYYEDNTIQVPFFKPIHYIAIPEEIYLESAENSIVAGQYLFNEVTGEDDYLKRKIILNGENYYLFYIDYIEPFNSYINVKFKEAMWDFSTIVYYKNVDSRPDNEDIALGNTYNLSGSNLFQTSVTTKGHYFAIPDGYVVSTIESASFRGDWLYNPATGDDVYTRESITINHRKYILWYAEFPVPLNATIEVKFNI